MNYYDPWQHAIHLFCTRVMQYLALLVVLGLVVWACVLGWYFDLGLIGAARTTWAMVHATAREWRAIFGLCFLAGALMSGWLFTWLILRARLRGGDRYHRGARVVHRDAQD